MMRPEEYLRIVVRRWWLIPLIALVAAAVAYLYTNSQPRVYNSSAEVIAIGEPPDYWMDLYAKNRLASYKKILSDPAITDRAVRDGGLDKLGLDGGSVRGALALAHNPDTNTVQIAANDSDPRRAAAIVNAVVRSFITENDEQNTRLAQEFPRRNTNGDPVTGAIGRVRMEQLAPASPAAQASAPRPKLNAAAGAILGAVLALVLIVVLEYLDDTLRTTEEVRRYLNLPVLVTVPSRSGSRLGAQPEHQRG